jgi:hypothetical protein
VTRRPAQPAEKWQLSAWPDGPRFARKPGGPGHVSTCLWRRDYGNPGSARRAASQVHRRYPDATIELTRFTFRGFAWFGQETETLYWCPVCGHRLDPVEHDAYMCGGCGSEWHAATIEGKPMSDYVRPGAFSMETSAEHAN